MKILSVPWAYWKRLARALGDLNARILFSLMYFLFTWPFALIVRMKHKPFAHPKNSTWHATPSPTDDHERFIKQY